MASAAATAATVEGSDRAHVQYRSHLQTYGWQNWKNDGDISGTTGKTKRLESLKLELKNKDYTGGICYNAHGRQSDGRPIQINLQHGRKMVSFAGQQEMQRD